MLESGAVFSWGINKHGQLGLGNKLSRIDPQLIETLPKVTDMIDCGWFHTVVIAGN